MGYPEVLLSARLFTIFDKNVRIIAKTFYIYMYYSKGELL